MRILLVLLLVFAQDEKKELKEGDKAPDFTLKNQEGKKVTQSKIKEWIVLAFYPMAGTPG